MSARLCIPTPVPGGAPAILLLPVSTLRADALNTPLRRSRGAERPPRGLRAHEPRINPHKHRHGLDASVHLPPLAAGPGTLTLDGEANTEGGGTAGPARTLHVLLL